jgi:serralysin
MSPIANPTLAAIITFMNEINASGIIQALGFQTILGTPDANIIQGGAGKDFIRGFQSKDRLSGGDNVDVLDGGEGNDILKGEEGNDFLTGDFDIDDNLMVSGNDILDGGNGDDFLVGWLGNDTLIGRAGMDFLFGDIPFLSALIPADSATNDDNLSGGDGNDFLFGGRGNDILNGGNNDDLLVGDDFSADAATVTAFLKFAQQLLTNPTYNPQMALGQFAKAIWDADTTLDGSLNNDTLKGGNGNDKLLAGNGNDTLVGGNGNDWLIGGYGEDSLTGGAGSDYFVVNDLLDSNTSFDRITDFNVAEDFLHVSLPESSGMPQAITPEQLVIGSSALETDDIFIYNSFNGVLFFDGDGSGSMAKVAVAKLGVGLSLQANNIMTL